LARLAIAQAKRSFGTRVLSAQT